MACCGNGSCSTPKGPDQGNQTLQVVEAMALAAREVLGAMPKLKQAATVGFVFARQCRALSESNLLPGVTDAVRQAVLRRFNGLTTSPEVVDKVVSESDDPDHPYTLLVLSDEIVRIKCRMAAKETGMPNGMVMFLQGMGLGGAPGDDE